MFHVNRLLIMQVSQEIHINIKYTAIYEFLIGDEIFFFENLN